MAVVLALVLAFACGDDSDGGGDVAACLEGQVWYQGACCQRHCSGRMCGDDGCGGVCGSCTAPDACVDGWCVCQPACDYPRDDVACGWDGCGGLCSCAGEAVCTAGGACCQPSCEGRECGDDGCGSTCGWCMGGVCDEGACEAAVLAPATLVRTLTFADAAATGCQDLNGDGLPDNGASGMLDALAGFGIHVNGGLADEIQSGILRLGLVAAGFGDAGTTPIVSLYLGEPGTDAAMTVMTDRFGAPLYRSDEASWSGDDGLVTGEALLTLPYRNHDAELPFLVEHARLRLTGIELRDNGLDVGEGTLGGLVFKADLDRWLYTLRLWCATDPTAPADTCGYVQLTDMGLVETFLTWDQERPDCGKRLQTYDAYDPMRVVGTEENCQAVSVCFRFTAEAGTLFPPRGGPGSLALADLSGVEGPTISCGCRFDHGGTPSSAVLGGALLLLLAVAGLVAARRARPGPTSQGNGGLR